MPCYQVQYLSVKFKVKHLNLLKRAAEELQMTYRESKRFVNIGTVTIDLERGTAQARSQSSINAIKRQYSKVVLAEVARKKNWKLFKAQKQDEFVLQKY
ncbi:MAG: hypothetical protein KAQ85_10260 [Thermodesulfovibrionia bacterium]|nr:hypothetical protein [Thermodesulfovibrionia bacterium]